MSPHESDEAVLGAEARLFGRYLVGQEPAAEVVARYGEACRRLWPDAPRGADGARLAFVRRHAWSLGALDAAAALLDPAGQLRSRVLLAAAILETTPAHAEAFLPQQPTLPWLFVGLARSGGLAVLKALLGAVLWPWAGRETA
jgi:hypothetical protein